MPAGQSALWKYKAIYRQGDDRVGQWSDVVSLPVAGRGRAALLRSPNYFRAGAACRIEAERRRTAPPYREPAYLIVI
jgi:hypothetical protein